MSNIEEIHTATVQAKQEATDGRDILLAAGPEHYNPLLLTLGVLARQLTEIDLSQPIDHANQLQRTLAAAGEYYDSSHATYSSITAGTENEHAQRASSLLLQSANVINGREAAPAVQGTVTELGAAVTTELSEIQAVITALAARVDTLKGTVVEWGSDIVYVVGGKKPLFGHEPGSTEVALQEMNAYLGDVGAAGGTA